MGRGWGEYGGNTGGDPMDEPTVPMGKWGFPCSLIADLAKKKFWQKGSGNCIKEKRNIAVLVWGKRICTLV